MARTSPNADKPPFAVYYATLVVAGVLLTAAWLFLPVGRTQNRPRRTSDNSARPAPAEKMSPVEKEELLCLARGSSNCGPSATSALAVALSPKDKSRAPQKRPAPQNKKASRNKPRRNSHAPAQTDGPRSVLNIEFVDAQARECFTWPAEVTVFYHFGPFANAYIELNSETGPALAALNATPGIVWMEVAGTASKPPPPESKTTTLDPKGIQLPPIVRGGFRQDNGTLLTGAGAYLAILDTGADYRNPDFVQCLDGRPVSRIELLWDTTRPYRSQPSGNLPEHHIGKIFTKEQLTRALQGDTRARKACPKAKAPPPTDGKAKNLIGDIGDTDENGHGTAVASIAAGNGNNDPGHDDVKGVAPGARLIIVRMGRKGMENSYLLNAVAAWLDGFAGNTPLVISCSFGEHRGGHDGLRIAEQQLNARFHSKRPGRALVAAAGNDGARNIHQTLDFTHSSGPFRLALGDAGNKPARVEIYNAGELAITPPRGFKGDLKRQQWVNPLTKQTVVSLELRPGVELSISRRSGSSTSARADAYLLTTHFVAGVEVKPRFFKDGDAEKLVTMPATARSVLAVASYNHKNRFRLKGMDGEREMVLCGDATSNGRPFPTTLDDISYYSSWGFRNGAQVKPDLAAPGYLFRASVAVKTDGSRVLPWHNQIKSKDQGCGTEALDNTGNYVLFDGTSAAAPYTAGIIALMFEKQPRLTLGEVYAWLRNKELLGRGAPYVGGVPNIRWGHGQLHYEAVQKIFKKLD